jgi:L-seryl-tRNA(Ser) seleniumtransferase
LAALESTLRLYRDETTALAHIPTLRMIATPLVVLEEQAQQLASRIREADTDGRLEIEVLPGFSQVGGGSLPAQDLPTWTATIRSSHYSTQSIEERLRSAKTPIIGRIESDRYLLDVRTLQEGDSALIVEGVKELLAAHSTLSSR